MQGPEPPQQRRGMPGLGMRDAYASPPILAAGSTLEWLSGLVLALSAFMGWYSSSGDGLTTAIIGWHTGMLGKLVFFIGAVVVLIAVLREVGIQLIPPVIPESLVVIALGALATIFVLIGLFKIPEDFLPAD